MKNALILIFLILSTIASATDYYVSSSGNDVNNNGLSTSTPWKTIAKVNSAFSVIKPGDRILFSRGDTFYGTLKISKSGLAGSPIIIGAYGTGVNPIITGFTTITGWTSEGSGIYSKVITSAALTNMVTIDGVQQAMGRYPNSTYLTYESCVTNVSITDNGLGDLTDWAGAEVVIRKQDWVLDRCLITDHTGDVLTYTALQSSDNARAGYGYFIQNDLRCVNAYGEWYHNTGTGKFSMYFGAVNPTTKTVNVATINNLISNTGYDYITVDNITFTGSIADAITFSSSSDNCIIQNCTVSFGGLNGINITGANSVIDNNQISYCNRSGSVISGTGGTVTNNTISNIGLIAGTALDMQYCLGIYQEGANALIQYNTIENMGNGGIFIDHSGAATVQYNFINNIALLLDDCGAIYTSSGSAYKRIIDGNIILNAIGNDDGTTHTSTSRLATGIYLDEGAANVVVTNNTVANCSDAGIKLHKAHDNNMENNTSFNNYRGIFFQNSIGSITIYNNILHNNIFIAKTSLQTALYFLSATNDLTSFGTADNNYYARPIKDDDVFYTYEPSTGYKTRTLTGWQSYTNKDANSRKSPIPITDINDIRFEYNASKTNKVITLDKPMIDIKGTKYQSSITLLPYTSAVLIVDPNPAQPVMQNNPPILVIKNETSSYSGFVGEIDASGSYDPNNDVLTYEWTIPDNVSVSSISSSKIQFLSPVVKSAQVIEFQLRVNDGKAIVSRSIPINIMPYKPELAVARITSIEASDYQVPDSPNNVADGNVATKWSVNGDNQWLFLKLAAPFKISHLELAFLQGQKNASYFDIFASEDNLIWDPILTKAASCNFSGDRQEFDFPASKNNTEYSYLKLVGHGNSLNTLNNISEFKIFGILQQNSGSGDTEKMKILIYPNPAQNFFNISIEEPTLEPDIVRIIDYSGKIVFKDSLEPGTKNIQITNSLNIGVYIVELRSGSLTLDAQKLMIN